MPSLTRRRALQTGAAAATAAALPGGAFAQGSALVRLRILETTDLHVNVFAYDYYRDATDDTVGLGRTASLVKAARAEAKNSLLFDNGDLIQGTTLYKPWLILDREFTDESGAKQTIKVGVIGFVPPQIVQWDKANLDGKA